MATFEVTDHPSLEELLTGEEIEFARYQDRRVQIKLKNGRTIEIETESSSCCPCYCDLEITWSSPEEPFRNVWD